MTLRTKLSQPFKVPGRWKQVYEIPPWVVEEVLKIVGESLPKEKRKAARRFSKGGGGTWDVYMEERGYNSAIRDIKKSLGIGE